MRASGAFFQADRAMAGIEQGARDRQAETSAALSATRGEEGFEQPLAVGGRYARSVIGKVDADTLRQRRDRDRTASRAFTAAVIDQRPHHGLDRGGGNGDRGRASRQ